MHLKSCFLPVISLSWSNILPSKQGWEISCSFVFSPSFAFIVWKRRWRSCFARWEPPWCLWMWIYQLSCGVQTPEPYEREWVEALNILDQPWLGARESFFPRYINWFLVIQSDWCTKRKRLALIVCTVKVGRRLCRSDLVLLSHHSKFLGNKFLWQVVEVSWWQCKSCANWHY